MAESAAAVIDLNGGATIIQITWVSAADGTCTYAFEGTVAGAVMGKKCTMAVTKPSGTAAPTDNYDLVVTDELSCDILGGQGANRSATLSQQLVPAIGSLYGGRRVRAGLQMDITNAGDTKGGILALYFER